MARKNFANGFQFANSSKSLTDQIEEVKKSNKTREAKYTELIMLGLRDKEVQDILKTKVKVRVPRTYQYYTFGVEIECINAERNALINAVTAKGVEIFSDGYNHTDHKRRFKITRDGSLTGQNANEVVSPVLKSTNGMGKLKKVCESLREIHAGVNASCGLHCHIGAEGLTEQQYCNVFKNYYFMTSLIETFLAPSRRNGCSWCHRLPNEVLYANTIRDMQWACNRNRYFVVNPMSFDRHKTIEFRHHQGSVNFTKIQHWVHFCGKLVEWSKQNVLNNHLTSIDEIPFLTATEKAYFKGRKEYFAGRVA